MRANERLAHDVTATMSLEPWYGSSLRSILEGVDAELAASHPVSAAHSIWELVLHMTAWVREAARRLDGGEPGQPAEGDWPAVTRTDDAAWQAALSDLAKAHDDFAATVKRLADETLDARIGVDVDNFGHQVTVHRTVVGVLQHDAYHGGQAALLRKAAGR